MRGATHIPATWLVAFLHCRNRAGVDGKESFWLGNHEMDLISTHERDFCQGAEFLVVGREGAELPAAVSGVLTALYQSKRCSVCVSVMEERGVD